MKAGGGARSTPRKTRRATRTAVRVTARALRRSKSLRITTRVLALPQLELRGNFTVQRTIQDAMSKVQLQLDKQPTITSFFNKLPPLPTINVDEEDEHDHGIAWDDDETHITDMDVEPSAQVPPKKGFKRPPPPTHNKNLLARKKLKH